MDRAQVIRPERAVVNRAAQVAQNRISGISGAGGGGSLFPARESTKEGVDDDGNIITIRKMLWDVHEWDDPTVVWVDGAAGLNR